MRNLWHIAAGRSWGLRTRASRQIRHGHGDQAAGPGAVTELAVVVVSPTFYGTVLEERASMRARRGNGDGARQTVYDDRHQSIRFEEAAPAGHRAIAQQRTALGTIVREVSSRRDSLDI